MAWFSLGPEFYVEDFTLYTRYNLISSVFNEKFVQKNICFSIQKADHFPQFVFYTYTQIEEGVFLVKNDKRKEKKRKEKKRERT